MNENQETNAQAGRKPRGDSPLRRLAPERQDALMEYLETHTLKETKAWLAEQGVETSISALGAYRAAEEMRERAREEEAGVEVFLEELRRERPDLTEEEVFACGQMQFALRALRKGDDMAWSRAQRLRLSQARLNLEDRRVELIEKKGQDADQPTPYSSLTPEEKDERIKQIFGIK